jgi:hypothetical protein
VSERKGGTPRFFVHVGFELETLARAGDLIGLVPQQPAFRDALLGGSVVLTTAGLAQAIDNRLACVAADEWVHYEYDRPEIGEASIAELFNATLRHRMKQLPLLLSDGQLRLDSGHDVTRALHEVIDARNRLVHLDEKPVLITGDSPTLRSQPDPKGGIEFEMKVHIGAEAWTTLSVAACQRYLSAVTQFVLCVAHQTDLDEMKATPFIEAVGH